jgi:hypothetical protein
LERWPTTPRTCWSRSTCRTRACLPDWVSRWLDASRWSDRFSRRQLDEMPAPLTVPRGATVWWQNARADNTHRHADPSKQSIKRMPHSQLVRRRGTRGVWLVASPSAIPSAFQAAVIDGGASRVNSYSIDAPCIRRCRGEPARAAWCTRTFSCASAIQPEVKRFHEILAPVQDGASDAGNDCTDCS